MTFSVVLARILNRLNLLPYLNLVVTLHFNGRSYKIPVLGKVGFSHLYLRKDYDYTVYDFFKKDILKGTFLDIGASIGQTVLRVAAVDPDIPVVSIEPNPNCLYYLNELRRYNKFKSLTILPVAVFDNPGLQKLFVLNSFDTSASILAGNREGYFDTESFYFINAANGEQLKQTLPDRISFVKIDVEGAELEAMRALKEIIDRDKPILYCEVLDAHNKSTQQSNRQFKELLYSYVVSVLNYRVHSLDTASRRLTAIDQFPDRVYETRNLDRCNYVFIPDCL